MVNKKTTRKKPAAKRTTHGAVLVNLSINQFGNEKADKTIVQEVARTHNASFSRDRYLKQTLPPAVLGSIHSQISSVRAYHYRVTAPWFDRGIRMMAAGFIMPYKAEMDRLKVKLYAYIKEVAKELPAHEAEAMRTRGTLFEPGDIPTAAEFIAAYKVSIELLPISTEEDFRVDYITNKNRKEFTENNRIRFKKQTEHIVSLAIAPLLRLKASMSNQERAPKIHGTTIEALDWWCDNADGLLVDRTLEQKIQVLSKSIKTEVCAGYEPDKKPKYNPDAIEGALECIETSIGVLQSCI
jgi:hypothetical protein